MKVVFVVFVCRGQSQKPKLTLAQESSILTLLRVCYSEYAMTSEFFHGFSSSMVFSIGHHGRQRLSVSRLLVIFSKVPVLHFAPNRTKLLHECSVLSILLRLKQMSTLKHTTDVVVFTSQSSLSLLILSCRVK